MTPSQQAALKAIVEAILAGTYVHPVDSAIPSVVPQVPTRVSTFASSATDESSTGPPINDNQVRVDHAVHPERAHRTSNWQRAADIMMQAGCNPFYAEALRNAMRISRNRDDTFTCKNVSLKALRDAIMVFLSGTLAQHPTFAPNMSALIRSFNLSDRFKCVQCPEDVNIYDLLANEGSPAGFLARPERSIFLLTGTVTIVTPTLITFLYVPGEVGTPGFIFPTDDGQIIILGTTAQGHALRRRRTLWTNCLCQYLAKHPDHKCPTGTEWTETTFQIWKFCFC